MTAGDGKIELTEEQLSRVTGGHLVLACVSFTASRAAAMGHSPVLALSRTMNRSAIGTGRLVLVVRARFFGDLLSGDHDLRTSYANPCNMRIFKKVFVRRCD